MSRIIGIDLGTTNSLCATFEDGTPRLIPNSCGGYLTPSVVGIREGRVLVGEAAKELRLTHPGQCAASFKRWMGEGRRVTLAGKTFSPPELSALILRALRQDAEATLGEEIADAVITVPAYFNDNQRKATKLAGEFAGFKVHRIINEPTAAALVYGLHERRGDKRIMVFDLGGGTFDVTVMEVFESTLEIVSTAGESFLGGQDFTSRLICHALEREGLRPEDTELRHPLMFARLREECEKAKIRLTTEEAASIRIPDREGGVTPGCAVRDVSRKEFESLIGDLMEKIAAPVDRALRDAGCTTADIEDAILVGGATRAPIVRRFVESYCGTRPLATHDPDRVVALGAAVQAALICDDKAVEDIVMTDVCPFSLGIGIAKQFGSRIQSGYYLPVIHRNTTIPVSREETVATVHANQRVMDIEIYQGEARKTRDNLLLGRLKVKGIPSAPPGYPVHVRFTYDLNGILSVEAIVSGPGKKFETVLTNNVKGLSKSEVKKAISALDKLKFFPRDDVRNQRLILFCERLTAEVDPVSRQALDASLDQFESAMSSGDRALFEEARQALLVTVSALGFEYREGESQ